MDERHRSRSTGNGSSRSRDLNRLASRAAVELGRSCSLLAAADYTSSAPVRLSRSYRIPGAPMKKLVLIASACCVAISAFSACPAMSQVSSRFGSRPPRKCPAIASAPSATQAAQLVQCTMDYETPQQAKLHQDIVVQLDAPRNPRDSDRWPGIDSRFQVVDFKANATVFLCGPILEAVMHNTGSNCDRYQFRSSPGVCWKTIEGSYRCQINAGLPTDPSRSQAPPTTY